MKIYTRTGDDGTTGLFGGGRVPKHNPRIEAYGTVDETNSFVGLARAHAQSHPQSERLHALLEPVQSELFVLGADLATPAGSRARTTRIDQDAVDRLERAIDDLEADLPALKHFILPGGSLTASTLHVARTVCRRAERLVVEAASQDAISSLAAIYLNRLSDFLFVAARWANLTEGSPEQVWRPDL